MPALRVGVIPMLCRREFGCQAPSSAVGVSPGILCEMVGAWRLTALLGLVSAVIGAATGRVRAPRRRDPHPVRSPTDLCRRAGDVGCTFQSLARSSCAIAWLSSLISGAVASSAHCSGLVALTIGAVMAGRASSQANAVCAGVA